MGAAFRGYVLRTAIWGPKLRFAPSLRSAPAYRFAPVELRSPEAGGLKPPSSFHYEEMIRASGQFATLVSTWIASLRTLKSVLGR